MNLDAMDRNELKERLLPADSSQEDGYGRQISHLQRHEPTHLRCALLAFICLLASVLGNIYQYRQVCQPERTKDLGRSQFSDHRLWPAPLSILD